MKILLAASQGGHMSELQALKSAFEGHELYWASYPGPATAHCDLLVDNIGTSPWRMMVAFWKFFFAIRRFRPDIVISTGAEIAIPAVICGKMHKARCLYIECSARVTSASETGKILSRHVDDLWVQWPEAAAAFDGKAAYQGSTF